MSPDPAATAHPVARAHDLPRVALVGPVRPFRGGVAQYTTRLRHALGAKSMLQTISYERQYPAWLYPGQSDREPAQASHRESGVEYLLDALNPWSWHSAVHRISDERCELAIFDWWTLFWAPAIALMAWRLRRRGIRVVFVCHNLFDHDAGVFKRKVATTLLSPADGYLVHSAEQQTALQSSFPGKPVVAHPMPPFDHFPPASVRMPQRGRLELLFFGFIRPYKGLDVLVDALGRLADRAVHLTVVGEPWLPAEELRRRIAASGAPNIELHLDYVDDHAAANFFARADLVVLPYLAASGSAVAAMAIHYDCPILATRTGGFPDVVDEGRTGFLISPGSAQELADAIRPLTRARLEEMRANVRAWKSRFGWDSLAECLLALTGTAKPARRSDTQPEAPCLR